MAVPLFSDDDGDGDEYLIFTEGLLNTKHCLEHLFHFVSFNPQWNY